MDSNHLILKTNGIKPDYNLKRVAQDLNLFRNLDELLDY